MSDGGEHQQVSIREGAGGGVCLAGASEREVHSREELLALLEQGSLLRATAATGMNKRSSRSHAIFTITLEQRRVSDSGDAGSEPDTAEGALEWDQDAPQDDYLCAKMHLVDLAGASLRSWMPSSSRTCRRVHPSVQHA